MILLTALAVIAPRVAAQAPEHDLKAAFIYNFVQFTQWPEGAMRGGTIAICASPGSMLHMALQGLSGKTAHGRSVMIVPLMSAAQGDCHVLVATSDDRPRALQIRKLAEGSVLGITDDPELLRDGRLVIAMSVESGRITFTVDNTRAGEAGLVVSSRLLRLARSVR